MSTPAIPDAYRWLSKEPAPKLLLEALKLYGTKEIRGDDNNPVILGWAAEVGGWVAEYYKADSIPWCGLFVGVCAGRAGFPFGQKMLGAKNWIGWGNPVDLPAGQHPMLGDVLVFVRDGGGHVGIYVGEDDQAYHVLGGNQSDAVTIARIAKDRLLAARRCPWKVAQPQNVRRVFLKAQGGLSENEA